MAARKKKEEPLLPPPLEKDILKECLQYLKRVRGWVAWRNKSIDQM